MFNDDDGNIRPNQKPLSLRWDHRDVWSDLIKHIGAGDKTTAAVMLDLALSGEWGSDSRNKTHFLMPRRYRNGLYTYLGITRSMDLLDRMGLIEHAKAAPGQRGWQSAAKALPCLQEAVGSVLKGNAPILAKPIETIIRRDADGNLADYRDNPSTRKMRMELAGINEFIMSADISDNLKAPMVRIFNRTFNRGGRFYATGGAWQSMKKADRQMIQIDGEPVAEIDYKTLHPAILYAQAGAQLPDDSYAIDGWPRQLVKRALLILINAKTRATARMALANEYAMKDMAEPGSQEALQIAEQLFDDIAKHHKPIAWAFHSDKGAELMTLDAELSKTIMLFMNAQGITVLPVHDSYLVPQSKAEILSEIMLKTAHEIGLACLQIERVSG